MIAHRGWGSANARGFALCATALLAPCACNDKESLPQFPLPADAGAVPDGEPQLDAGALGFRSAVYPLFVQYCGECHAVDGPYHDIASPDLAEAYADAVEYADRIVARIEQGNMPPQCVFDDSTCVPADALATIERWIASGTPE